MKYQSPFVLSLSKPVSHKETLRQAPGQRLKRFQLQRTESITSLQVINRNSSVTTISKIEASTENTGLALSPKQLKIVCELLQGNLPDHQAWAFGSRATGYARKYSDLDIAVSHPQALSFHKLCQLSSAFEASDSDICGDIVDWPRGQPRVSAPC